MSESQKNRRFYYGVLITTAAQQQYRDKRMPTAIWRPEITILSN